MLKTNKILPLCDAFKAAESRFKLTGEVMVVYHQIEDDSYRFCPEWVWDIFVKFGYPKSEFYCLVTNQT